MKNFLVLFREPDGRKDEHTDVEIQNHRQNWNQWFTKYINEGNITGGSGLTLEGRLIKGIDAQVEETIHYVGTEIVGGFMTLKAPNLDEATHIVKSCPIFEFGGYAEVREYNG